MRLRSIRGFLCPISSHFLSPLELLSESERYVDMNYEEALQYMDGRLRFGWKLGNERMEHACELLGNPQLKAKVVHIAGTKGKGSTTALCARILCEAGYSVGSYFSPYVYDVRERIQIGGEMISRDDFALMMTEMRPAVDSFDESEWGPITEFELKTLLAFVYFAHKGVDFAVIEVGLGGRLDATNVVHPLVTAITNIGLDHTDILGDTHAKIAFEKAGILKRGVPIFTGAQNEEALTVIRERANSMNAPLTHIVEGGQPESGRICWSLSAENSESEQTANISVVTPSHRYTDLRVGLVGRYQRENAALAVAVAESAVELCGEELEEEAIRRGLESARLPGRFEMFTLPNGALVVLDGAHNEMAGRALRGALDTVRRENRIQRTLFVMGIMTGHAPGGVLSALAEGVAALYACRADWRRAMPSSELSETARNYVADVRDCGTVEAAIRAALNDLQPADMLLVSGSFYVVGEASPERIQEWYKGRSGE